MTEEEFMQIVSDIVEDIEESRISILEVFNDEDDDVDVEYPFTVWADLLVDALTNDELYDPSQGSL